MNKSFFTGVLIENPSIKELNGGTRVAKFNISLNGDESVKMSIEAWDDLCDYTKEHLKKDDFVLVEGKYKVEKWKDEEGNPKIKYIIEAVKLEV